MLFENKAINLEEFLKSKLDSELLKAATSTDITSFRTKVHLQSGSGDLSIKISFPIDYINPKNLKGINSELLLKMGFILCEPNSYTNRINEKTMEPYLPYLIRKRKKKTSEIFEDGTIDKEIEFWEISYFITKEDTRKSKDETAVRHIPLMGKIANYLFQKNFDLKNIK